MKTRPPTQPGLDAELGVGRLARLDRHLRARRGHACVAEAEAPRMMDDGAHARSRRLARCSLVDDSFALVASLLDAGCLCAFASCWASSVGREVRARRRSGRSALTNAKPSDGDQRRQRPAGSSARRSDGEHEQTDDEREQRRARVGGEQRGEEQRRRAAGPSAGRAAGRRTARRRAGSTSRAARGTSR